MKSFFYPFFLIVSLLGVSGCTNEKATPDYQEFPDEIGKIVFTKCAIPGCHNDQSKAGAGYLSMESWDKLFEGGSGSACVIPYRHDYSTFFYYINTYSDLGVTLSPTMPFTKPALSREEVLTLRNWIDAGAPNKMGEVKFADNPSRKKFYVTNQGCDVVTVFDQETQLPMRYINVGATSGTESPHMVRVSPDGNYWYVIFLGGNYLEKHRTSDDAWVSSAFIGSGYWNTFAITSDGQTAYCIDFSSGGKIATVNLNTMTSSSLAPFNYPHGCTLNQNEDTLYVTENVATSSLLYKIPLSDFSSLTEIPLYTTPPAVGLNAHEVRFCPDHSKYFVTCQGTSEVRVFQTGTDQLLAIIPVGDLPAEMSFSTTHPYVFVTCTEDLTTTPGKRGSVAVINYQTNTLVTKIYTGHQPHGIEVDDDKDVVYVANRNATNDGPAPHHSSECGGRNGYITFIDMSTLTMRNSPYSNSMKKIETSVDPYSISVRH